VFFPRSGAFLALNRCPTGFRCPLIPVNPVF
jgi:hypothetical protein